MANMVTFTAGGVQYTVRDPNAVHYNAADGATDAQKAQALENIGGASAAEVADLKSALDEIRHYKTSNNIYYKSSDIVTGKYLNYQTGNEGINDAYMYAKDYYQIKAETTYVGCAFNPDNISQKLGTFNDFVLFYDSNKQFISGTPLPVSTGVFTTPTNTRYARFSMTIAAYNRAICIVEGNDYTQVVYEEYFKNAMINDTSVPLNYIIEHLPSVNLPLKIVDINGRGDFTSISEAVASLESGGTIIVLPGVYVNQVEAWNKEVHIIGVDRQTCILKDTSGNYSTPPLEIDHGSVVNMSIIEIVESADVTTENMSAYGVHIEGHGLANNELLFKNCLIYSNVSAAVGMGLRGGGIVRFEDCELVVGPVTGTTKSAWGGPLYFHDADSPSYRGTAHVYVQNCMIRNQSSRPGVLTINSIHNDNVTYMHYIRTGWIQDSSDSRKFNTWNSAGNTDADGWNGLSKMYLSKDSYGNNLSELNYV